MEKEVRAFRVIDFELREAQEGGSPVIEGYAAVFGDMSEDLGGFYEKIERGAFAATLDKADVRALWNHNADYPLGRMKAGTLMLGEDERGLKFSINLPDTQYARDLLVSMRRGDVDQMSFGFRTVRDRWEQKGGQVIRTLLEVELFDVSPVTYPAYPTTSAAVRSQLEAFNRTSQEADAAASGAAEAKVRHANRKRKIQLLSMK